MAVRGLVGGFVLAFVPLAPLYAWDLAWYAYSADEAAVTSSSYAPASPVLALAAYVCIFAAPFVAGLRHRAYGAVGAASGMFAAAFVATLTYDRFLWLVYPAGTSPAHAESRVWVGSSLLLIAILVGIPCGAAGWGAGALAARIRRRRARSAVSAARRNAVSAVPTDRHPGRGGAIGGR